MRQLLAICIFATTVATSPLQADPTVSIAWNGCPGTEGVVGEPSRNEDWSGNSTEYRFYVSAEGIEVEPGQKVYAHEVGILIGPDIPDAWRFDPDGCVVGKLGEIRYHSESVKGCERLGNEPSLPVVGYLYDRWLKQGVLTATIAYPNGVVPDPKKSYLLWEIVLPLSKAQAGSDTTSCSGADRPLCVRVVKTTLYAGTDPRQATVRLEGELDNAHITWNDAENEVGCPDVVEAWSDSVYVEE